MTVLTSKLQMEDQKLIEISSDMTNQYKRMQEQLFTEINDLGQVIEEQKEVIDKRSGEISNLEDEKDQAIRLKNDQIKDLGRKIDEMSNEFARMLRVRLFWFYGIGNSGKNVEETRIGAVG